MRRVIVCNFLASALLMFAFNPPAMAWFGAKSQKLLGEWFNEHESIVLIMETLTDQTSLGSGEWKKKKRELSKDCERAIQQDLEEEEPDEYWARMGMKIHIYLSSSNSSYVDLISHPNCVESFVDAGGSASQGRRLCSDKEKRNNARVLTDDDGIPMAYSSAGARWGIDADDFSKRNRVVRLNSTQNGELLTNFAYVCVIN